MITTTQTTPLTPAQQKRKIVLAHGGGGQLTDELIDSIVLPRLGNQVLTDLLDSAVLNQNGRQFAMTTDSFVVQPLFFPGADIGRLAVCGTINDLAVSGAKPMGLSLGMILAEGLEKKVLEQVIDSIAQAANEAGVQIVTGDTKVVGSHQADGIYLTTTGVGLIDKPNQLHPEKVQPGDVIIINGPIADHGLAVMLAREMPQVESVLKSDAAPLNHLIESVTSQTDGVVFMRDPTRSGVTGVVVELAQRSNYHIILNESNLPLRPETQHAADMLGLDPLEVANEGKVIMVVRGKEEKKVLDLLNQHPLGKEACVIGHVESDKDAICELHTIMGGQRILQKPYGEQLPRIC